ncbi:MAG TPA: ATP-binding cassette domain-containing protein, partial [Spirochaetia bacterium]|nr:ATP-binding cassette domain-containing protein [Spirochaetia bacterium]
MSEALLSVTGLHHWFGGLHVINDVDFSCRAGVVQAIIGPNGAGKTTLFNLVAGSLSPTSGSIAFEGRPIEGLPAHRIAGLGVARTFQATRLFSGMTVLENVMVGRHRKSRGSFLTDLAGRLFNGRRDDRMRRACMEILDSLGIVGLADTQAKDLPFGRQRMVELARALAAEPKLLL